MSLAKLKEYMENREPEDEAYDLNISGIYHRFTCRFRGDHIVKKTLAELKELGARPCKACKPKQY